MAYPMTEMLRLYSYWRSSAAYRVRIGLGLKGLPFEILPVHLEARVGERRLGVAPERIVLDGLAPGARVAIISSADRMTEDAQAAFLKTLEEPPPHS